MNRLHTQEVLPKEVLDSWVDVVALSAQVCKIPIVGDLKYSGCDNFMGRPALGYRPDAGSVCMMTRRAGRVLCEVQNRLTSQFGIGLVIFDSYRPFRAAQDFLKWTKQTPVDTQQQIIEAERKAIHYPHLEKSTIAERGYLASGISRHCYGETVDVGLRSVSGASAGKDIEMGAVFDFFDEISHFTAPARLIGEEAFRIRHLLASVMEGVGFQVYEKEYWHFEYKPQDGALASLPQDFEITSNLRGLGV